MIESIVQVERVCSIALFVIGDGLLPDNEVLIKGMARAQLPDGDWAFDRLEWDSSRAAIVFYTEEEG